MRPECERAAAPFRLALPRARLQGTAGERTGGGAGASLELLELREYVPGDDLRHLDWRAYGRSDKLQVRLYRNEIAPWVDIVIDTSASMAVTDRKARAALDLAEAFPLWSVRAAGRPRLLTAGGGAVAPGTALRLEGGDRASLCPRVPLRANGVRVLISDLFRTRDPAPDLARLAIGAAHVFCIQVLDPWEIEPTPDGPLELVDAERGYRVDVDVTEETVAVYRRRLARLQGAAARAVRAAGGSFCTVRADAPERMFRGELLRRGVIEPAA